MNCMQTFFKRPDLFEIFWNNLKCLKHSEMIEEHFKVFKTFLNLWEHY